MPTADQRLDQLEPVISELLARQDETAAKVERVSAQVRQLTTTVANILTILTTQSDNIEFLLAKNVQVEQRLDKLEHGQQRLEQGQQQLEQGQQQLAQGQQHLEQRFDGLFAYLKEKLG